MIYIPLALLCLWLIIALVSNALNNRTLKQLRRKHEGELNEILSKVESWTDADVHR